MALHIALTIGSDEQSYDKLFSNLKSIAESQVKKDIRILTIGMPKAVQYERLVEFFKFYLRKDYFNKQKVKFSVIGKWYDLPGSIVDSLKKIINETKDYDSYFLNFALNYDGQEEITDACRLLCRQVLAGKQSIEKIEKSSIKDCLYSSYFVPPELIIVTGKEEKWNGFMLWDSVGARIVFTGRDFSEFSLSEFESIIRSR